MIVHSTLSRLLIRSSVQTARRRFQAAYTLMEVMVVTAIVGVLLAVAVPTYQEYIDQSENIETTVELTSIAVQIEDYFIENGRLPDTLEQIGLGASVDSWGNPYQYLNISTAKGKGKLRKDKNLVPINTDFDLYSMGPDGRSVSPLTAKASRDDIIRANDGGYYGVAEDY